MLIQPDKKSYTIALFFGGKIQLFISFENSLLHLDMLVNGGPIYFFSMSMYKKKGGNCSFEPNAVEKA